MAEQEKIHHLEDKIKELERSLSAKEKICDILMKRVERSIDSVGGAYSIFERNILLQKLVDQRSRELEDANKKLSHEINERVKGEQELQNVIQGSPIPEFVIRKDHKVLYWNKALEELSGIKAGEVIGTRQHWKAFYSKKRPCLADLLVDETLEAIPQWYSGKYIKSKLIEGAYEAIDFFPELGDGGKWLRFTAASIRDFQGDLVGAIETLEDITERKQAEDALIESQQRLAGIINFLPDAAMVIDRDGKLIAWNRAIEDMTGVRAKEMLGKGNYEHAIPFYKERRPILIDLVLQPKEEVERKYRTIKWQGEIIIGEAYISDLRGNTVYLLGTASPLYDTKGSIVGAIETIRDITDSRKMEKELASEHDRLAAILDGIPIPAFVIDLNHAVVLWNRNNEIFTGKSKDEMLGRRLDLRFLAKDKTPYALAELVLKMSDEDLICKYGSKGVLKSNIFPGAFESIGPIFLGGEEHIMSIQAARIYNQQGEVIGAVQTAQDITERIRIQEEQEKLQSQLIQAQKMEAIGILAGGIAHDFNNILTGIMGYTELYKEAVRDQPKVYHSMEQVLKATERAKDLVQQILAFSRKAEPEKKPIAIAPIVEEVVNFMRASLPATIEITLKSKEPSDVIMADPSQMHQVLVNLCTNAGYAMKDTGGVLEIGMEEVFIGADDRLNHPSIRLGHYLELSVRDTGQGISRENLGRIFEPYFTTKVKGEGTGLGLAVVHGIVKDHGGEIRIYSEVGKGTIFRIYLPLLEQHTEYTADARETILRGKGETILFVDDEKMVVELNRELLEALGYRVVTETDPVKAIEAFKENRDAFDLLITDKTMPRLTGFDVVREVRSIRTDIPVILCSGFQEKEDLEKLTALGINQLIAKPIKMSILAKAIRDVLDKDRFETQKT